MLIFNVAFYLFIETIAFIMKLIIVHHMVEAFRTMCNTHVKPLGATTIYRMQNLIIMLM
jgi:hypothetical protein